MEEVGVGGILEGGGSEEPVFTNVARVVPCTWQECTAGHKWPPQVKVAQCPGCGGVTLAFKQENCPFCNEPVARVQMRTDLVPVGGGVVPRCRTGKSIAESIDITFERRAWQTAQQEFKFMEDKAGAQESSNR